MKITREQLKELNAKGSVEIHTMFGGKEDWDILRVED